MQLVFIASIVILIGHLTIGIEPTLVLAAVLILLIGVITA